jgi:hypothetical protein
MKNNSYGEDFLEFANALYLHAQGVAKNEAELTPGLKFRDSSFEEWLCAPAQESIESFYETFVAMKKAGLLSTPHEWIYEAEMALANEKPTDSARYVRAAEAARDSERFLRAAKAALDAEAGVVH